ncbi:terminase small subunit [Oxalobacteraceae bacterium A2-2]
MGLTGRKRAFADAKLAGLSNKDAAIAAGYSAATASAAGSRLVKNAEVSQYLAEQAKELRKRGAGKAAPATGKAAAKAPATKPERPPFDLAALLHHSDPKAFLKAVMNEPTVDIKHRVDAAKSLMPFEHKKLGEGGKKDQQQQDAEKVGGRSRFAAAQAPRLAAAGGKKV